ncbi:unnamed protein product [Pieris macdunnoughi]|uniref:CBF1-interacting co-repressor CIR N-terminal domain-containing protein n=1 Tax=Pieris macdunnoughi TaxID=345717 RepID=A0A821LV46_9NEOP|nr:unnamed protein product [Pieris macdunnoughi]
MGGGDLNSKKSWHPNTMKNQERVWKAEKVAAEEKKRILELQQERAQEKDRQELNELARKNAANNSDNRLDWMYNKPDKQVQHEEYLLGKAIDKNFEQHGKPEHSEIPAVARRVVGSSMLSAASDVQVDLVRKIREDPLLLRKKLTELLRKEQEQKKGHKEKKKHKKKDKDLDNMLAAKLTALSSNKIDLAKLLESDDSSDDDSSVEEKSKKKKKKSKSKNKNSDKSRKKNKTEKSKSKKHRTKNDSSSDSDESIDTGQKHSRKRSSSGDNESVPHNKKHKNDSPEQYSPDNRQNIRHEPQYKRYYDYEANQTQFNKISRDRNEDKYRHHSEAQSNRETKRCSPIRKMNRNEKSNEQSRSKKGLSDAEKAARLAEMAAAGAEREIQRGRRVAEQKEENKAAEKASASRMPSRNEARAIPDSLESRIHSNRHYIQRSEKHMSENFARR